MRYLFFNKNKIQFDKVMELSTKWNFLNFKPGLVGGHCLPVDPIFRRSSKKLSKNKSNFIWKIYKQLYDKICVFFNFKKMVGKFKKQMILSGRLTKRCSRFRNSLSIEIYNIVRKNT